MKSYKAILKEGLKTSLQNSLARKDLSQLEKKNLIKAYHKMIKM